MENNEFQYGLHSIKKLTSYLNSPDSLGIQNLENEKIGIRRNFQIEFNYNTTGILSIKLGIDYFYRTEGTEPLKLFGSTIQCEFKLIGYEKVLIKDEKGHVNIPDDFLITLLSVTYSTARGILASYTAGTSYEDYFLPLINTSDFKKMLSNIDKETRE